MYLYSLCAVNIVMYILLQIVIIIEKKKHARAVHFTKYGAQSSIIVIFLCDTNIALSETVYVVYMQIRIYYFIKY